jgi:hypothetical protein
LAVIVIGIVAAACAGTVNTAPGPRAPDEEEDDSTDEGLEPRSENIAAVRRHAGAHAGPCAPDLASCPDRGCGDEGSAQAAFNRAKRGGSRTPSNGAPKLIRHAEVVELEQMAERLFPNHRELSAEKRHQLEELKLSDGTILGEGMTVRLVGFLAPPGDKPSEGPHPGGIESVNCKLKSVHERDVHIPVLEHRGDSECQGVVVETLPQSLEQHPAWTSSNLRAIAKEGRAVLFEGPLFFDNEHVPNTDCAAPKPGQPKRASVWEIHPVTRIRICSATRCEAGSEVGWTEF